MKRGDVTVPRSDDCGPAEIMRLLVDVFAQFKDLAQWLGQQTGVASSDYSCWMSRAERNGEDSFAIGAGDGFEIEWYASADLDSGVIIAFTMRVFSEAGSWLLESAVTGRAAHEEEEQLSTRAINADGESVLQAIREMAFEIFDQRATSFLGFNRRYASRREAPSPPGT